MQHLVEAMFWFLVVIGDETKAPGIMILLQAFAHDYLKPTCLAVVAVTGMDKTAVNTHRKWFIGVWQSMPVILAAVREHELFSPSSLSLRRLVRMLVNAGEIGFQREDFLDQGWLYLNGAAGQTLISLRPD